jgi:hypothetical protein
MEKIDKAIDTQSLIRQTTLNRPRSAGSYHSRSKTFNHFSLGQKSPSRIVWTPSEKSISGDKYQPKYVVELRSTTPTKLKEANSREPIRKDQRRCKSMTNLRNKEGQDA